MKRLSVKNCLPLFVLFLVACSPKTQLLKTKPVTHQNFYVAKLERDGKDDQDFNWFVLRDSNHKVIRDSAEMEVYKNFYGQDYNGNFLFEKNHFVSRRNKYNFHKAKRHLYLGINAYKRKDYFNTLSEFAKVEAADSTFKYFSDLALWQSLTYQGMKDPEKAQRFQNFFKEYSTRIDYRKPWFLLDTNCTGITCLKSNRHYAHGFDYAPYYIRDYYGTKPNYAQSRSIHLSPLFFDQFGLNLGLIWHDIENINIGVMYYLSKEVHLGQFRMEYIFDWDKYKRFANKLSMDYYGGILESDSKNKKLHNARLSYEASYAITPKFYSALHGSYSLFNPQNKFEGKDYLYWEDHTAEIGFSYYVWEDIGASFLFEVMRREKIFGIELDGYFIRFNLDDPRISFGVQFQKDILGVKNFSDR